MAAIFAIAFIGTPFLLSMVLPLAAQTALYEGTTVSGSLAQFGIFGISALIFVKAVRRYHGRGFWSLIGPYQTAWHHMRKVAVAVGLLLILVQVVLPWGQWGEPSLAHNPLVWLMIVPLALAAILIQVITEEIVFRGYLQQQLACLSTSRWLWMGVPSILFGAIHFWNGNSGPEGFVYAIWAGMLGAACADLTARTGTLGAAIGLHLGTNVAATLFVAVDEWPMSGLALFLLPCVNADEVSAEIAAIAGPWMTFSILFSTLSVLTMWLAARVALRR
ncbi:type II CAAX endopeptidase family protein [Yoonia sp. BS5-3]|uniref:Type II CAAX endopeptidase family protein n=1 Tax=Yoonia phaeophyticola TaxID=3137369 RepID=A0ABZ2V5N4_9RHOB